MSKDKISDYSATANSNTDIGGINIDEGCAPSGINDAIRTLMKQLKDWQSGSQDVYIHPAGSASVPSITATGDTNTGLFFPAADTVGITTGGTERARIDSSGNLGLGVTPSAWTAGKALQVGTSAAVWGLTRSVAITSNSYYDSADKYLTTGAAGQYVITSAGGHNWYTAASGTAGNAITFTQAMTLDTSGNLGIGQTSPGARLESAGNLRVTNSTATNSAIFQVTSDATGSNGVNLEATYYGSGGFGPIKFTTSSTERARIDSSGNLLVGKTSIGVSTAGFEVGNTGALFSSIASSTNSNSTLHAYSTTAGAYRFYVGLGGTVYATSTTISAISDIRFKENVRDLNVGLAEVMALKPRLYDWKEGKGADIKNARGFIAQEFEEVFPDLIDEWKDPAPEGEEPYKSVRQDLIPVLVKAIQEMKTIIDQQAERIAALEAK